MKLLAETMVNETSTGYSSEHRNSLKPDSFEMAQENVLDGIWENIPIAVECSVSFGSTLDAQIECLWRTDCIHHY